MLVGTDKKIRGSTINVKIGDTVINTTQNAKLLGLHIDPYLKWDKQVEYIWKVIAPKIGLLHRISQVLPHNLLCTVYNTIIQPHFDYAISIWGKCSKERISVVQRLQNRAARAITKNYDYTIPSSKIIQKLGWMNIHKRYKYFTGILMFKSLNKLAPLPLQNVFLLSVQSIHTIQEKLLMMHYLYPNATLNATNKVLNMLERICGTISQ